MKKIAKSYRIHTYINDMLKAMTNISKETETSLIEEAIVDKYRAMGFKEVFNGDRVNYINYQIKSLEKARNEEK